MVDQDAVRGDVDLALGVAEPGDLLAVRGSGAGHRGQAVEVAGADLAGAAAGEDLQQDHAHGLRVVEPAGQDLRAVAAGDVHLLAAGQPEQRQRGGDLRQGVVVDVVPVGQGGLVRDPGDLPEPAVGVGLGELIPRRRTRGLPRASAGLAATNANSSATARRSSLISLGWTISARCRLPPDRVAGSASHRRNAAACPAAAAGSPRTSRGSVKTADSHRSKRSRHGQPFLADGRPPQGTGLQHRAQVPFDRIAQPRAGDLAW